MFKKIIHFIFFLEWNDVGFIFVGTKKNEIVSWNEMNKTMVLHNLRDILKVHNMNRFFNKIVATQFVNGNPGPLNIIDHRCKMGRYTNELYQMLGRNKTLETSIIGADSDIDDINIARKAFPHIHFHHTDRLQIWNDWFVYQHCIHEYQPKDFCQMVDNIASSSTSKTMLIRHRQSDIDENAFLGYVNVHRHDIVRTQLGADHFIAIVFYPHIFVEDGLCCA